MGRGDAIGTAVGGRVGEMRDACECGRSWGERWLVQ